MTGRDLALYGRFPARRVDRLGALIEHLVQAGLSATQPPSETTPPGSVNPAVMP
jgi:hypothetical protein